MSRSDPIGFDFCKRVAHDDHPKRLFHHHARRQLRRLADALSLAPGAFDGQHLYRSLRGGHRSALFSIAEHGVQASG
jgi:hypothetical protein